MKYIKKKKPAVKVVVVTGSPINEEILHRIEPYVRANKAALPIIYLNNEALKLADAVINKPFDIEEMLAKIKELSDN